MISKDYESAAHYIEALEKENKQLKNKLAVECEHCPAFESNDALKAQIERLRHWVKNAGRHARILKETPAQSLAEHDATLMGKYADCLIYADGHADTIVLIAESLRAEASRIRQQALESKS